MKLYLVCDETVVGEHWRRALMDFKPIELLSVHDVSSQPSGTVFIVDTMVRDFLDSITNDSNHRLMILSAIPDFKQAQNFLQKGAKGYGNAMMHATHLQSAFQTLEEGNVWLYPDFVTQLMADVREQHSHEELVLHRLDALSIREREVALLLNQGKSHLEISQELDITVRTIKAHCSAIYEKLQVKDRLALTLLLHS